MKDFWNQRYQAKSYAYGTKPNQFLDRELQKLKPGKILLPFEGEGRNAVFCAKLEWEVDAFDFSEKAQLKAKNLARVSNVDFKYKVCKLKQFQFSENRYDAVALIFAHPPIKDRSFLHQQVIKTLKPGGTLLMEAFHLRQLTNQLTSGGPKRKEMLFTKELLQQDFADLQIDRFEEVNMELAEGEFHQGKAEVIRLVAKKM